MQTLQPKQVEHKVSSFVSLMLQRSYRTKQNQHPNCILKMFQLKIETLLSWGYMEIGNSNLKSRRGTVRRRKQKRNPNPSRAELQCLRRFWRLSNILTRYNTRTWACTESLVLTESMTEVSWPKLKSLGPCIEII